MENWRVVWREGLAPQLSLAGLEALAEGLAENDPDLLQGQTVRPLANEQTLLWPVQAACALSYCAWRGDRLGTVALVEERYVEVCREADLTLGRVGAHHDFLTWYDYTPRAEVRRLLLGEILRELVRRLRSAHEELQCRGAHALPTAVSA